MIDSHSPQTLTSQLIIAHLLAHHPEIRETDKLSGLIKDFLTNNDVVDPLERDAFLEGDREGRRAYTRQIKTWMQEITPVEIENTIEMEAQPAVETPVLPIMPVISSGQSKLGHVKALYLYGMEAQKTWTEIVELLMQECGIKENTARMYVHKCKTGKI